MSTRSILTGYIRKKQPNIRTIIKVNRDKASAQLLTILECLRYAGLVNLQKEDSNYEHYIVVDRIIKSTGYAFAFQFDKAKSDTKRLLKKLKIDTFKHDNKTAYKVYPERGHDAKIWAEQNAQRAGSFGIDAGIVKL